MQRERSLEDLIAGWEGVGVVSRFDRETGSWFFVALHSDALGTPTGGTRLASYPAPADGLMDAMRLAAGMTAKWAAAGIGFGGAKAVIAVPGSLEGEARRGLLRRYGALVESLHGSFRTGEDLGTTPEDMEQIASATSYVLGVAGDGGGPLTDPGPFTARGVLLCQRAALAHLFGDGDPAGRHVVIQGVGDVGGPLARSLAAAGAHLTLADVDAGRAAALAAEIGAATVAPDAVYDVECDLFAPCAVGAVLNAGTIPRLACRGVAGSANNQLAGDDDAARLLARGILYAPDYVTNAGGAIAFARLVADPHAPADDLYARVERLEATMGEILAEAAARGESPLAAAHRRVERALAAARDDGRTAAGRGR